MRTPVLTASLLIAAAVPVVADGELAGSQIPAAQTKAIPNNPHDAHPQCHSTAWWWYANCAQIRSSEQQAYKTAAASGPQVVVIDAEGQRSTGRRNTFDQDAVKPFILETTFSGKAWMKRYTPILPSIPYGQTAHPEWEAHGDGTSINSCDEYAYKRYYQANRALDAIGQLVTSNRYSDAMRVIFEGVPASSTAKKIEPLRLETIVDYDDQPITVFNNDFTGGPKAPLTVPSYANPFYLVPIELIEALPPTGEAWQERIPAALARSNSRTTFPPTSWENANLLRQNPLYTTMPAGERDDIAKRITAMRSALNRARREFWTCTNERYRAQTASTAVFPDGKTFDQWIEVITDDGVTDPVDYNELALIARLVDTQQWSNTLSDVVTVSSLEKSLSGAYARTRTGKLLRQLGAYNFTALQTAVANTQYTFKSANYNTCNTAYYEAARLLVAEYDRYAASPSEGCLGTTSKCEFSLPVFARDVSDQLASRTSDADKAKDVCLTYLGANFDGQSYVPLDKRANLDTFETFLKDRRAQIQQVLRDTPTASSLPDSIGDRRAGAANWGDPASFGAGYQYDAEWGVNITKTGKDGKGKDFACQLGGEVRGSLRGWVSLFGINRNLLDAGLRARTAQTDASLSAADKLPDFKAHVNLLGIDVFRVDEEKLATSYDKHNKDSFDVPVVNTTVILGFIPVTIRAGFGFEYGYRLNGKFTQSACVTWPSRPTLKLQGEVTPHAGAEAFVEAYVDLFVVGAGVKGTLTLVEAKLPFNALLEVKLDETNSLAVHAGTSLDLQLTELSGSLSFVVKVIEITVWEHELFSWPGIRQIVNLWRTDVVFPLIGFSMLPD